MSQSPYGAPQGPPHPWAAAQPSAAQPLLPWPVQAAPPQQQPPIHAAPRPAWPGYQAPAAQLAPPQGQMQPPPAQAVQTQPPWAVQAPVLAPPRSAGPPSLQQMPSIVCLYFVQWCSGASPRRRRGARRRLRYRLPACGAAAPHLDLVQCRRSRYTLFEPHLQATATRSSCGARCMWRRPRRTFSARSLYLLRSPSRRSLVSRRRRLVRSRWEAFSTTRRLSISARWGPSDAIAARPTCARLWNSRMAAVDSSAPSAMLLRQVVY